MKIRYSYYLIYIISIIFFSCESDSDTVPQKEYDYDLNSLEKIEIDTTNVVYTYSEPEHILKGKEYYPDNVTLIRDENFRKDDSNNYYTETTDYIYDKNRLLTNTKNFDFKNRLVRQIMFINIYNDSGELVLTQYINDETTITNFEYDEDGNIKNRFILLEHGDTHVSDYKFSMDGSQVTVDYYFKSLYPERIVQDILTFNSDFQVIHYKCLNPGESIPVTETFYEYDNNNNLVKKIYYRDGAHSKTIINTYDDYNRIISTQQEGKESYTSYSYSNNSFKRIRVIDPGFYPFYYLFNFEY